MGNQRPLETVRGVAEALFVSDPNLEIDDDNVELSAGKPQRRMWTSLDRQTSDIDLPVITTARVKTADGTSRNIDFHEVYWAPLMDEARFVAVPLWLFELVQKGPDKMLAGLKGLWWVIGLLLAFWIFCTVLIAMTAINSWLGVGERSGIWDTVIPWGLAAVACGGLMGRRGLGLLVLLFMAPVLASVLASVLAHLAPTFFAGLLSGSWVPMGLGSQSSLGVAVSAIAAFFVLNFVVLLSVVGDAARYFRKAPSNVAVRMAVRALGVGPLSRLHASKLGGDFKYDRIVVVSHSLGTVVAYDMLRAYWSLVAKSLGDPLKLKGGKAQNARFAVTENERPAWRTACRELIRELERRPMKAREPISATAPARRWIVTDFVTLGSPLSQAEFLLAEGKTASALTASFQKKKRERELPTSPAQKLDHDGSLAYSLGLAGSLFHHAALFGLTRWSNLYFPLHALAWGDFVAGPVSRTRAGAELFGGGVEDLSVYGAPLGNWMAHTHYWSHTETRPSPNHLVKLRAAVNLLDK